MTQPDHPEILGRCNCGIRAGDTYVHREDFALRDMPPFAAEVDPDMVRRGACEDLAPLGCARLAGSLC